MCILVSYHLKAEGSGVRGWRMSVGGNAWCLHWGMVLAASCSLVVAGLFWVCFGWESSQLTLILSSSRENMHTRILKSVLYFIIAAVILYRCCSSM